METPVSGFSSRCSWRSSSPDGVQFVWCQGVSGKQLRAVTDGRSHMDDHEWTIMNRKDGVVNF